MSEAAHPAIDPVPAAEPLRLDQFLKLCGAVGTGGQAKVFIQAGEVLVNGEQETRRRRKLCSSDRVEFASELFLVSDYVQE